MFEAGFCSPYNSLLWSHMLDFVFCAVLYRTAQPYWRVVCSIWIFISPEEENSQMLLMDENSWQQSICCWYCNKNVLKSTPFEFICKSDSKRAILCFCDSRDLINPFIFRMQVNHKPHTYHEVQGQEQCFYMNRAHSF